MKNSFIRALALGVAIAIPAAAFAQAPAGDAPGAEKTKKPAAAAKDEKAPAAGDKAPAGDAAAKPAKKSKAKKAAGDKAAGGDAGKTTP